MLDHRNRRRSGRLNVQDVSTPNAAQMLGATVQPLSLLAAAAERERAGRFPFTSADERTLEDVLLLEDVSGQLES